MNVCTHLFLFYTTERRCVVENWGKNCFHKLLCTLKIQFTRITFNSRNSFNFGEKKPCQRNTKELLSEIFLNIYDSSSIQQWASVPHTKWLQRQTHLWRDPWAVSLPRCAHIIKINEIMIIARRGLNMIKS